MKSSNGSSGLIVDKFSCKIPIFFSLSHPDGLKREKKAVPNTAGAMTYVLGRKLLYGVGFSTNKRKNNAS